jgi:hypothetical protein
MASTQETPVTCVTPVTPVTPDVTQKVSTVSVENADEEYDCIKFVNIVYDVRRMPNEVFKCFFEEIMKENEMRKVFQKALVSDTDV